MDSRVSRAIQSDVESKIPVCLYWSVEEVADWVEEIGFPQYINCFKDNFVNGRKLIVIDSSALPSMGVHDFEHIKDITRSIRRLLDLPKVKKRETAMKDPKYAYIEIKRRSGPFTDNLTYKNFLRDNRHYFPDHTRNLSA